MNTYLKNQLVEKKRGVEDITRRCASSTWEMGERKGRKWDVTILASNCELVGETDHPPD